MATYKNARAALTTSAADVYTAPSGGARVTLIQAANVDGTNSATVTVQWTDASNTDTVTRLAYQVEVAGGESIPLPGGGLILENGDKLQALASAASDIELTVSVVEN